MKYCILSDSLLDYLSFDNSIFHYVKWTDPKGRTPLLIACSEPEVHHAARVLLQIGVNIIAYKPSIVIVALSYS